MLKKPSEDSIIYCIFRCWKEDFWLKILTISSTFLIITSFFLPPQGIVDPSVMAAVGEMMGIGAIWELDKAIDKNLSAKVKIKQIELSINKEAKMHEHNDEPAE